MEYFNKGYRVKKEMKSILLILGIRVFYSIYSTRIVCACSSRNT
jgi:hypothetical protein